MNVELRPKALQSGIVRLVGAGESRIIAATAGLLDDPLAYAQAARGGNPFGDGHASERIVAALAPSLMRAGHNS